MKDLNGFLKRIPCRYRYIFLTILLIILTPLLIKETSFFQLFASDTGDFRIISTFEHTLEEESVKTDAILQIRSDRPRVISYYNATIPLEDLRVVCKNLNTRQTVECTPSYRGSTTDVMINLDNFVIRPDEPLEIKISYSTSIYAKSYNLTSEIYDTATNSVLIRYSKDLGEPLWSSDPIHNVRSVGDRYEILINKPINPRISLLFGERLLYKFEINKVFSNTVSEGNQTFELYVPSDTPFQKIIWEEISPIPDVALRDEDGNYVFKYSVEQDETIDCNISGYIQKMQPLEDDDENPLFLTQTRGYWSITNSTEFRRLNNYLRRKGLEIEDNFNDIESLNENERELFYKYVYEYVIERLTYERDIPLGIGTQIRLGANTIVDSSNNVSNIDYADFYIALLRKYGVPSRLVLGYISNITGYTSDGFYHYWVEYFDLNSNTWVKTDPFLEEYFGKKLFGSPFLDHITVLRRGKSPVAPKMTFFQESDFLVKAATEEDINPEFLIESSLSFEKYKSTDQFVKAYIDIENKGNIALTSYEIFGSNIDNLASFADPVNNLHSQIILPDQKGRVQFNIPYEKLESRNIFVNIEYENNGRYRLEQTLETDTEEIVPLYLSILSKIVSVLAFCGILFLIYFIAKKAKRILNRKKKK